MSKAKIGWLLVGIATPLTLICIKGCHSIRSYYDAVAQLSHAKQVVTALYFLDSSQRYSLASPAFGSDSPNKETHHFVDFETKEALDWLYYGGQPILREKSSPENSPRIILAAPKMVKIGSSWKRITMYSDGSGTVLDEDKFVRQLSDQFNTK